MPARSLRSTPLLVCVLALGAACGSAPEPDPEPAPEPDPPTTTATDAEDPGPESEDTSRPEETSAEPGSTTPQNPEVVTTGLEVPWGLDFLPDGDALVTLRDRAEVLRVTPDGDLTTLGTIADVTADGEGGLLGLAVSPEFETDATIYLYFTTATDNRVQAFTVENDTITPGEVILAEIPRASFHNGGQIRFGPDDHLYIGTGDAGDMSLSQDTSSLAGKILRIGADGEIPADNPDPDSAMWSLGHRNVQGMAWDAEGQMFASEFGQDDFDELNLIEPGENYGWPEVEGVGGAGDFVDPLLVWTPAQASPSGIAIADGAVWMAALRGESLWQVPLIGVDEVGEPERFFEGDYGRLRTAVAAPDGRLWVLTNNTSGGDPSADDDQFIAFELVS